MRPLKVTATIAPLGIAIPGESIALDALLAWAVAQREQLAPPMSADEIVPIEIPVRKDVHNRFHLASVAQFKRADHELRYINRRFPVEAAQTHGRDIARVQTTAGPAKSHRIPLEIIYPVGNLLWWWCVGDAAGITDLLGDVHYLGKKRNAGHGHVVAWDVAAVNDPWFGFPVSRDGQPLRPLPADWPGLLGDQRILEARLTYPYWLHTDLAPCAMP